MLVKLSAAMHFLNKLNQGIKPNNSVRTLFASLLICFSTLGLADAHTALSEFNQLYQEFLNDHLEPGSKAGLPANLIDYPSVKEDPRITELIDSLEHYPKDRLVSNEQKIAFYLNAYNILAIDKVAKNWPLFRLRSLGNFIKPVWTHPVPDVCGEKMTLRKLEHEILRKLGDPRIHFALNCASMSCPDLRAEPYEASKIEQQLEEQTKKFLAQQGKGYEIVGDAEIKLSPLFDWFEADFKSVGGESYYVNKYLPKSDKPWKIVGYLEYNWDVNCHLSASDKRRLTKKRRNTWFD